MSFLSEFISKVCPANSPVARFRLVLGAVALGLLGWLVFLADKPWNFVQPDSVRWRIAEYVSLYSFWAAVLNLVVLAVLIASAGWWAGRLKNPPAPETGLTRTKWFWPLVIAAMIFCGASAAMRMNFGFAHDEDYSARRVITGAYELKPNGEVTIDRLKWQETFFYYRKPNNHPLHSVFSRLCVTAWQMVAPPVKWHVKEWIVRIPAWIGGVGAVGLLAVLLRRLGSPRAGVAAAWLLALHPWVVRYASEARGYSLLMALIPLCLYCWLRAVRSNRWRWWLAFGAAEFALIYCYPGGVYILVILNVLTLGWLIRQARADGDSTTIGRWFAVNCLAAVLAVQMMLPLVPQLQKFMKTDEARQPLKAEWIVNTAAHFFVGVSWTKNPPPGSLNPELLPHAKRHPLFFGTLAGALFGLGVIGYISMFRRKWPDAPIAAATLLLPGLVGFIMAKLMYQWLFEWYLIYLLPGLVAGVAAGAEATGRWLVNRSGRPWTVGLPALAVVLAYGIFSQPFRHWYCTNAVEPVKEATLAIRESLDPNDPRHGNRLTGVLLGKAWFYDPHAVLLRTPEEFVALMRRADAEKKPLYIMVPHPWAGAFKAGPLWRMFNEAGLFTDYQTFYGFDETHNRVVARYVPRAVQDFDAPTFLRGRGAVPHPHQPPLVHPDEPEIYPED